MSCALPDEVVEIDADNGSSQVRGVSAHGDDGRAVVPDDLPLPADTCRPAGTDRDPRANCQLMREPADQARVTVRATDPLDEKAHGAFQPWLGSLTGYG
jgi:hypothetical protein